MSAKSEKIEITVFLDNELYNEFHAKTSSLGATHVGIIRILVKNWVNDSCFHSASDSHTSNSSRAKIVRR